MSRPIAKHPEDLAAFFVERANAHDLEGLVALYAPDAVLAGMDGAMAVGHEAIRTVYAAMLAAHSHFTAGIAAPTLLRGDLALTSTRLINGKVTAEVAQRQADGSWLWVLDQPLINPRPGS
ncbi:MAG: nuclear transport factor 2 family protein [Rhodocyclaceae bacterium]|nr:nuclear transport factor 2 family protein [Rhodocyclaceae bacterium]